MKAAHRYHFLLSLLVIVSFFPVILCSAQNNQTYLLWGKTSETAQGLLARQSDVDLQQNLYIIGSEIRKIPRENDPTQTRSIHYIFIRKYDTNGNLKWSRAFGTNHESCRVGDIRADKAGDIIFSGYINDPEGINFNVPVTGTFFCKMNNQGEVIWTKPLSKTEPNSWINSQYSSFGSESKMEIDRDNNIVIYSNFNPTGERDSLHGLYITCYSSEGDILKQYQLSQDENTNPPSTGGFTIDKAGNFIVIGYYFNGIRLGNTTFGNVSRQASTPARIFIAKFNSEGKLQWAKTSQNEHSLGTDVATDNTNNVYLTGVTHGTLTLGNLPIRQEDSFSGFIVKLDQTGEGVWVKLISGTPSNIKTTHNDEVYVTGSTSIDLTFDNYKLSGTGEEIFILKIVPEKTYESALLSRGIAEIPRFKVAHNTCIDDEGNIYTLGTFQEHAIFGCDTLTAPALDMFIIKYRELPPLHGLRIDGPNGICEGASVKLSSDDIPLPAEFYWKYTQTMELLSQSDNEIQLATSALSDGDTITLTVLKECYTYESREPYVLTLIERPDSVNLEDPLICESTTTRVHVNAVHATRYRWSLPDGVTAQGNVTETTSPYIDISVPDTFTEGIITAAADNECYEGNTLASITIKLLRQLTPIAFVNGVPEYCNNAAQTLEVTPATHATSYVWLVPGDIEPGGVITSDAPHLTFAMAKAGENSIQVYAQNDCYQTDSITHTFKMVSPLPTPEVTPLVCDQALATTVIENVVWMKDNTLFAEGDSTVTASERGVYYVTVSNICGSEQSESVNFVPFNNENLFIPNVITPNDDAYNSTFILRPQAVGFQVEIFNRWGRQIFESANYQDDWDGENFDAGIYFIQVDHECLEKKYTGWLHIRR